MTSEVAPLQALQKLIGTSGKPIVIEMEKGLIRKFAEAIEDSNPLWQDEPYARKGRCGGIVAPPGLFFSAMFSGGATRPEVPLPFPRILDGGGEWEFLLPARAGDVITSVTRLADVYAREGKAGKMLFLVFETTHQNQWGETVAKSRGTLINLE